MNDKIKIKVHTSFVGTTGYNAHAQDFFTALSKLVKLKIRNFTVGKSWQGLQTDPHAGEKYLDNYQKKLIGEQTLMGDDGFYDVEIYDGLSDIEDYDIDLVLNETNHHYFYDIAKFKGKFKIAYNVWESTRQPQFFFNQLLKFDQFWCPSEWQKQVTIDQGFPADRVFVVPEGVNGRIFCPEIVDNLPSEYDDNRFKFIIFGRWDYRKSTKELIETFLNTFDKSEPVDLVISVDNPFSVDGMASTQERLNHYGFNDDRIKILNFLSRKDYIKYMKSGHVFLSCARSEGWNLPLCVPEGKLIFGNDVFIPIENIKENDFVISHTGIERKVLHTFKRKYEGNIIKIDLFNDSEILEVTPEHPIYAIKRNRFITKKGRFNNILNMKPEWIKSRDVEKGDIILRTTIPQKYYKSEIIDLYKLDDTLLYDNDKVWYKTGFNSKGEQKKYNRFINLWDLSFLFGWYIAEGCDGEYKLFFSLNAQKELHIAEKIISEMNKIFGADGTYEIKDNKLIVTFCSTILCKFFTFFCNKLSYNKKIPEKILLGPDNILSDLIDNMVLGDGSYSTDRYSYTTVSYILARQLLFANQRLNKKTSLQINKRKRIDKRTCFTLTWSECNENFRHSNKSWWHPEGIAMLVKNVHSDIYNGYVYNLEVEEDNSYLMSNATLHNCEAIACGTPAIYSDWGAQLQFAKGKGYPVKVLDERPIDNSKTYGLGKESADKSHGINAEVGMDGYYIEPDFDDLSRVMRDVYTNYWDYKSKALEDSEILRKEFTWENAAKTAYEILEDTYLKTLQKKEPEELIEKGNYKFFYRKNTSDVSQLEYDFEMYSSVYKPKIGDIIIDVGAYIGTFAIPISKNVGKVYCIEPQLDTFNILTKNIKLNNVLNVESYNFALYNETTDKKLYYDNTNFWSSNFTIPTKNYSLVKTKTLDDFLIQKNIERCNFLKLNCEGSEFEIILNSTKEVLNKIDNILILYHCDYNPKYTETDLITHLNKCGFETMITNKTEKRGWINATKKKSVSIVTSFFNSEKYIDEAIESVLNQTYKDFEYIVTDDFSDDKTYEKLQEWIKKDKRIKYVQQNEKQEIYWSPHKYANGDIVVCFDSDDFLLPKAIEVLVHMFEDNPEVVLIDANSLHYKENFLPENFIKPRFTKKYKFFRNYLTYHKYYVNHEDYRFGETWGGLRSFRNILDKNYNFKDNFDLKLGRHEDLIKFLKFEELGKILYLGRVIHKVREHEGSNTKKLEPLEFDEIWSKVEERRKKLKINEPTISLKYDNLWENTYATYYSKLNEEKDSKKISIINSGFNENQQKLFREIYFDHEIHFDDIHPDYDYYFLNFYTLAHVQNFVESLQKLRRNKTIKVTAQTLIPEAEPDAILNEGTVKKFLSSLFYYKWYTYANSYFFADFEIEATENPFPFVFLTGGDKKYLPLIEKCVQSLNENSEIPVIVYGFNCDVDFDSPNMEKRRININRQKTFFDRDTRVYYYKIDASLDCIKKDPSKTYIWLDGDCIATKNIDSIIQYHFKLENYPLCMRYSHENLLHMRINSLGERYAGHGDEVGSILNVKRNNNFTAATGLYMFDKRSETFFKEIIEKHEEFLKTIDASDYVDDMALAEERVLNALFWKYNYKNFLPITWISKDYFKMQPVENIFTPKTKKNIEDGFDIMFDFSNDEPLLSEISSDKILFYHGQTNINKIEEKYKQLKETNKLMIVAHPDDEIIFGGGLLLNDFGWKVVCVTKGDGDNNNSEIRLKEFKKVMSYLGVEYEILNYPDDLNTVKYDESQLKRDLKKIIDAKKWNMIVTHNEKGEYGHIIHKSIHKIVSELSPKNLYFFDISTTKLEQNSYKEKIKLLNFYESQNTNLPGFKEYLIFEGIKPNKRDEAEIEIENNDTKDINIYKGRGLNIIYNFDDLAAFVEIKDDRKNQYKTEFIDGDSNEIIYTTTIKNNMWAGTNKMKKQLNWIIRIFDLNNNQLIFQKTYKNEKRKL